MVYIKQELFTNKIYVYIFGGGIVEFPRGLTIIDLAYKMNIDIGNTLVGTKINDEFMNKVGYILKNKDKDRVIILTDYITYGPREELLDNVHTSYA